MAFDNPVARILVVIEKARSLPSDKIAYWSHVFPPREGRTRVAYEVLRMMIETNEQCDLAIDLLKTTEVAFDKQVCLVTLDKIQKALDLKRVEQSQLGIAQLKSIPGSEIELLKLASHALSAAHSEQVVDPIELEELRVDVFALVDQVRGSTFPDQMKRLLLKQLEALLIAIVEYSVVGFDRLDEETPRIVGLIELARANDADPTGIFKKLKTIGGSFLSVTKFAYQHRELIGAGVRLGQLVLAEPKSDAIPPIGLLKS